MPNFSFVPLEGTIQNIRPFGDECCSSLVTLQTSEGTVTVVVSSDTYVISEVRLRRGMTVAAFLRCPGSCSTYLSSSVPCCHPWEKAAK